MIKPWILPDIHEIQTEARKALDELARRTKVIEPTGILEEIKNNRHCNYD